MELLKFEEMGLSESILKAIDDMGFLEPSPIQSLSIPVILKGKDIIGQAQTGTGKTAAFGIPIIEKINNNENRIQSLILTPTRELAIQVSGEMLKLSKYKKNIKSIPIYGGQSIERQIKLLKYGAQIIVATPGRLIDHLERRTINLDFVRYLVLDEADEMLNMGFLDDIYKIMEHIDIKNAQISLFSATMPKEIENLAKKFLKDPELIKIEHKQLTVPKIKQIYYEVKQSEKADALTRILDYYNPSLCIVFVNTKIEVEELKEKLHIAGYSVEALHGDMKQTQRDYVMKRFRNNDFEILIATDVAARGLDINDIELVINYDLPQDDEYYVHRIGRTARAGKEGLAISLLTLKEYRKLRDIEKYIKTKIERAKLPSVKDIKDKLITNAINIIKNTIETENLDKYETIITEELGEYDSLDIAKALMKLFLGKNDQDIDEESENSEDSYENKMIRFFINIGKNDGVLSKKDLIELIHKNTNISSKMLGDITLLDKFSFVSVPENLAGDFVSLMSGIRHKNRKINVEIANTK